MSFPDEKRLTLACFVACVIINLGFSAVGWNHGLREAHEFRQVQTAFSARAIQQEGWQPAYPLPLFGPPWSAPFEFPFYQVFVAKLGSVTGLPLEQAGRATSLLFLYLSLPALYLLQAFLPIPRPRWLLLPALVLVSPVYLYYSRTFMIESLALAASAWFLLAFAHALARPSWRGLLAAGVLGVAAALAKSTTFTVFVLAAGLLALNRLRQVQREGRSRVFRTLAWSIALMVPGMVAAAVWTRYTDQVKALNPLAQSLGSGQLGEFIFGTLRFRFDPAFWGDIGTHIAVTTLNPANAMLLAVFGAILAVQRRWATAALLLCFAAGPLIFPRLYSVHDYYFYASGVFILAALAVAWSNLLDLPQFPRVANYAVVGLSLALQLAGYATTYFHIQREPTPPPPELAAVLAAVTQPRDTVLIVGQDWNPTLPYFAGRRAIMVRDDAVDKPDCLDRVLSRLGPDEKVTALVVTGEYRKYPGFVGPLTQRLGLQPDPLLMSSDTHLFLATAATSEAMVRVGLMHLQAFTLIDNAIENLNMPRHRYAGDRLADPRIRQIVGDQLEEIVHPFDLAVHEVDGRLALDAHAPTDLVFNVKPGQSQLVIEFGILPAAWQAERPTDGIEFRVELVPTEGRSQVLFSQLVQPVEKPTDRKAQQVTLTLPANAAGKLRLRTLPGPATSIACDWAYWCKVELR